MSGKGVQMSEVLRLYHSSKAGIDGPIRPIGSSVNDFGRGFYLGDEPSQPLTLICRGEKPTFYTCEMDLAGLRVHRFADGLDWALFVAWNRDMIPEEFRSVYDERFQSLRGADDVLVGRIANDRMFIVLDMFFKNTLSDAALVDCLKALNLGNQYCALTDAACARVKIVDSRVLSAAECQTLREKSLRQRQRAIDEVERIRLRHLHDGLFFQEILEREAKGGVS